MQQGRNQWMFTGRNAVSEDAGWVKAGMRVLKFLASLRLAVVIILSLMAAMAAGTFVESAEGTQAAVLVVYDSLWFYAILFMLGVNVFAVMIDRIPWQKKHTGFLITHLGIILVLVGSFVTRSTMVDGQLTLAEGESSSYVTLTHKPLVYVFEHASQKDWIFPLKRKPFAWTGKEDLRSEKKHSGDPVLKLLHYYPKARVKENLVNADEGPAALTLTIKNDFVEQQLSLIEDDAEKGRISMGPAVFSFSKLKLEQTIETADQQGFIEFVFPERSLQVPFDPAGPFPVSYALEGTPYEVTVRRHLKNAAVVGKELIDQAGASAGDNPETWLNPAVELTLTGPDLQEGHTTFAKYPEFPTVHGLKPSAAGVKVYYRLPHLNAAKTPNELRFVKEDGRLTYQIKDKNGLRGGDFTAGEIYETGWMGLTFKADEYLPHSRIEKEYLPLHNLSEAVDAVPAVQVEVAGGGSAQTVWLTQGRRESVRLGERQYELIYGFKRIPMGFKVQLKDFQIEHDPGTENPASFASDVVLKDDMKGIARDVHISMNEPLEYRGFKVYQAAYSLVPGEPEISIFSVGHDPGIPFKYIGTILIVAGAVVMFSMRKFVKPRT